MDEDVRVRVERGHRGVCVGGEGEGKGGGGGKRAERRGRRPTTGPGRVVICSGLRKRAERRSSELAQHLAILNSPGSLHSNFKRLGTW